MAKLIPFPQKLLVEGQDDQHVIWALCKKFDLTQNFEVIDCKGIDNLLSQIEVRLKESEIKTLGIIVDADQDIASRLSCIKSNLASSGIAIGDLDKNGLIEQHQEIKIGIWIMPNNNLNGMLEDFASFLIPTGDKLISKVNQTLEEIESDGIAKYQPIHKAKARIHTWLAWQEDPGTPMGLAITKRYLTTDEDVCTVFVNWLAALFR